MSIERGESEIRAFRVVGRVQGVGFRWWTRRVAEGLGLTGEACLYVGDGNSEELPGAKRHGMTTVWVDNGDQQHWKERFVPDGDYTVCDMLELHGIVDGLRGERRD